MVREKIRRGGRGGRRKKEEEEGSKAPKVSFLQKIEIIKDRMQITIGE